MNEWQPIETASKDGEPRLLWLKTAMDRNWQAMGVCNFCTIGFWEHEHWVSIEVEDCGSMGGEMTGYMDDWQHIRIEPSHWMLITDPLGERLGSQNRKLPFHVKTLVGREGIEPPTRPL